MIKTIQRFFKSIDFFKSLTLLFAALIPLGIFAWLGELTLAVSVAMGVFLCSPSDVPGSLRHMTFGILTSSIIATLTTFFMHLSFASVWFMVPVLSLLIFFNSMWSVYGFRASMVSFSGLLAVVLSFAHPFSGTELLIHVGLIFAGGMWYLIVATLAHVMVSRRHNQLILSECMTLTAKYLDIRGELMQNPDVDNTIQKELFHLQTQINEKHEKLREIYLTERTRSGGSHSANKYMLIFIELVDILELTLSIPTNHPEIKSDSEKQASLRPFADIMKAMSSRLEDLADVVAGAKKLKEKAEITRLYQNASRSIATYLSQHQLSRADEEILTLKSLFDYEHKQLQKIESIERVLQDLVDQEQIIQRSKDAEKFIPHQDYDPAILRQNLNTGSMMFRHSIRMAATVLIGYALGALLHIQNAYWIMLTIVVIMRPSYGLTKSRSMQRVSGTLLGGIIAFGIVLLTRNPVVYGTLAAISLVFAFSLVQKNYGGSAVFITLNIIFLYALIQPSALNVIQFRVYDTVIGAVLSFLASFLLWPSWEFSQIKKVISAGIRANRTYLQEISNYYQKKGELSTSYKLARKEAFLAFGHLSAAFQRMSQEPKSKRLNFASTYEMVVLNHTFLAAAASMGTFIQTHTTTEKSEHFQAFIDAIDENMNLAEATLNDDSPSEIKNVRQNLHHASTYLDQQYSLKAKKHEKATFEHDSNGRDDQLLEISQISRQLRWLLTLSENMRNSATSMTRDQV